MDCHAVIHYWANECDPVTGIYPEFFAKSSLIRISPCSFGMFPLASDLTRFILSDSLVPWVNRLRPVPNAGPWDLVSPFLPGTSTGPPNSILSAQSVYGNCSSSRALIPDASRRARSLGFWSEFSEYALVITLTCPVENLALISLVSPMKPFRQAWRSTVRVTTCETANRGMRLRLYRVSGLV